MNDFSDRVSADPIAQEVFLILTVDKIDMKRHYIILLILSAFVLLALALFVPISLLFPAYRIYNGPEHDRTGIMH
jgi:hypothetical protein